MKKPIPSVDHPAAENRALSSRFRALVSAFAVILAFAFSVCVVPSAQMGSRTAGIPGPFVSDSKAGSSFIAAAEAATATLAEAASGIAAGVQSSSVTFYLHGTGPTDNPPTLLLDATAPTATTAKFKDSASISRNNGNPWVEVGTWPAGSSLTTGSLTSLSDLHVWLGLKNSDDQGTNFDLRVEAYKNSTLITTGETLCVTGITRNATSAKEVVLSPASFSAVSFNGASDVLSVKVLTRVGSTPAGASCGGHNNAVGLRLYFDAVSRASKLSANLGAADTTAPVLTVTQPADGGVTNQNSVNVTGTVSDSSPVTVTVNGANVTVNNGSFSGQVNLNEGANQIRVAATDSSGNQSEVVRNVTLDTVGPLLTVTDPADGLVTNTSSLTVAGAVADGSPVTVTANGISVPVNGLLFATQLTLSEGSNQIGVVATDTLGNHSEGSRTVTLDTTNPVISNVIPAEGAFINSSTVSVQGRVVDATAVTVRVNDTEANVAANGLFTADIPIQEGSNSITIKVVDAAGNSASVALLLSGADLTPPSAPALFPASSPTRLDFQTIEGRAESESRITITGGAEPVTADAAFGTGLFAATVRLGDGSNVLQITATDAAGHQSVATNVTIVSDRTIAVPPAGQPAQINVATGNTQKGLVGSELPRPLIVIVTDGDGNPASNVTVTFGVLYGAGHFVNGGDSVVATTDVSGYASTHYISGSVAGVQLIRANFDGNTSTPADLIAEALQASGGPTTVSGIVQDQNLRGLPSALIRMGGQQTHTGLDGRFTIVNAASGAHQLLEVIGRDQISLPGRWPNISFDVDVLPGVDNKMGRPFFLPRVNEGIAMPLDANNVITSNTVYDMPVAAGETAVRVVARAGTRVTFPPDVTDKRLSVTRIPTNRVPMELEDGRAAGLYISVQPAGAIFDPPLDVRFPNFDQRPPNSQVLLMSFDHDAGRYVRVGTGRVTSDGRSVNNETGGIRVGAWHSFPPIPPQGEVTILGHIKVAGNPALEGKELLDSEAWVEGTRAVLLNGPPSGSAFGQPPSLLLYKAVLSVPAAPVRLVAMQANVRAAAPTITITPQQPIIGVGKTIDLTATLNTAPSGTPAFKWSTGDKDKATVAFASGNTASSHPNSVTVTGGKEAGVVKIKVEYQSSTGAKAKAEIEVTVVKVEFDEVQPCSGFDKSDPAPFWLTVILNGTFDNPQLGAPNTAKVKITPSTAATRINFVSADPTIATVQPATATATPQIISVTGLRFGETEVRAMLNNEVIGKLLIVVRRKYVINVAFHFMSDNAGHHTTRDTNANTLDAMLTQVNAIYTSQTGIEFHRGHIFLANVSQVQRNLGPIVSLATEVPDIIAFRDPNPPSDPRDPSAGNQDVYFVWDLEDTDTAPTGGERVTAANRNGPHGSDQLVDDTASALDMAHEFAHSVIEIPVHGPAVRPPRPPDPHHSNSLRELLYPIDNGRGCLIPKRDVDAFNPSR